MTLIAELLIVVGILGVLSGGVVCILSFPYRNLPFFGPSAMMIGLLLVLFGTVIDSNAIYLVLPIPK